MATAFVRSTDGSRARWRDGTAAIARWVLIAGLLTAGLVALRDDLEKAHVALAYLLVVLIGSARVGRTGGIALALVCFFCFNFFLLPPYHTLMVADPLDWLVLLAFLITSLVATELLHHAQFQATVASERTEEVNRLSVLGAETLNAGRAEEATQAIARVLQSTLAIDACELFEAVPGTTTFRLIGHAARAGFANEDVRTNDIFAYATENDVVVVQRTGGAIHVLATASGMANESALDQVDACVIVIPLRVRDRAVGILRLSHEVPIQLSPPQRRFALALAYYAALGVERLRLSAEAERAQALAAADQLKDAFVAAVSHDLRTPLTTIKGLAHELSVEGDERAETIEIEADRLNRLVADLLDLSRLNAGGFDAKPELNAVDDLVGAALAQLSGLPRARDLTVRLPAGAPLLGRFDFVYSLRALVNLTENALKYSDADTMVEIDAKQSGEEVVISVLDRGPGIADGEAARMFEPFVRGSGTGRSGAGLGLAIANGLALAQKGAIRYAPRAGGGSVFSLCLPAEQVITASVS